MTHVAVLMGGWSAEREVSLVSGKAVATALTNRGYEVTTLDVDRDVGQKLAELKPDVVFNALHGRWGEDGCVQGVLEVLGLPYTHSGVMASAVAMDKPLAKRLFQSDGIPVAHGVIVSREELLREEPIPRPFVIKPLNEGSSVGVRIVQDDDNDLESGTWPLEEKLLIEAYIPGREIQVAVMNGRALGGIEIRPKRGFYDYDAKYSEGLADHLMPAPVGAEVYARVLDYAERAHNVLGCRGVTRSDFRYDEANDALIILEINTQPGMTPLSLVPEIAAHSGLGFEDLVVALIDDAGVQR